MPKKPDDPEAVIPKPYHLKITGLNPEQVIIIVGGATQAFSILGEGLDADKLKAYILDDAGNEDSLLPVEQAGQIAPNRLSMTARARAGAKPGKRKIAVKTADAEVSTDGILVV